MKKRGFTLIELMIVVAIIGLLSAIALPKFGDVNESAKAASVQGNLANMRTAIAMFYAKTDEYPDLVGNENSLNSVAADGVSFTDYYSKSKSPITPAFTSGTSVVVKTNEITGVATVGLDNSDGGWAYYSSDGSIRADLPTTAYDQGIDWSEE